MQWLAVVLVALAGFTGAGTFSMWRTGHRRTAAVLGVLALVFLALGIAYMVPGPETS